MSLTKSPELWKDVFQIGEIAPENRLQYLLDLPPGGIHHALCNAQDWYDDTNEMRILFVAARSLSKIECETDCEAARYEARDTLEAILERLVSCLNFEESCQARSIAPSHPGRDC